MVDNNKPNTLPIFQRILAQAQKLGLVRERTRQAISWFRQKVSLIKTRVEDLRLVREKETHIGPLELGQIYVMEYKAKWYPKQLPYYDQFPIVLILHKTPNGFLGLNFHYLEPKLRAEFFQILLQMEVTDAATGLEKIKVRYQLLASSPRYKYFRPCMKRYLFNRIGRTFVKVLPEEWETALFLPTEKFIGATKQEVWADSKAKINKK